MGLTAAASRAVLVVSGVSLAYHGAAVPAATSTLLCTRGSSWA